MSAAAEPLPRDEGGCLCGHDWRAHYEYAHLSGMRPGMCYGCDCYPGIFGRCMEYRPRKGVRA